MGGVKNMHIFGSAVIGCFFVGGVVSPRSPRPSAVPSGERRVEKWLPVPARCLGWGTDVL